MYLIPLDNDSVYYNATTFDASSLASIVLLAIVYHPSYNNLLYLLYGCTSLASNGNTYGNINIMVRNMATSSFLQNSTIQQNIQCSRYCEIKVTDNLFLIQSQSYIAIYSLLSDQQVNVLSPAATFTKGNTYYIGGLARHADIYKNKYVALNDSNYLFTFGQVNSSSIAITILSANVSINNIVSVGMSDSWVFTAVNYTNISVILYNCVACIFNGSLKSVSKMIIDTNVLVSFNYRFYQGVQTSESNVTNANIFVGSGDGDTRKYYINQTTYYQDTDIQLYRIAAVTSANSYQYLAYGSSILISRLFAYNLSDQNLQLISFDNSIYLVAIDTDSRVIALHSSLNSWNVKQYQMVSNCSKYATNITNSSDITYFCSCYEYDTANFCAYIDTTNTTSTASSGGSLPIGAIVGAVAGVAMIAVSAIAIKKNYKRCLKRNRTPWKYNPVELMSFEV